MGAKTQRGGRVRTGGQGVEAISRREKIKEGRRGMNNGRARKGRLGKV